MKQHVVSQVLLRRWTNGEGRLVGHDLRYDHRKLKSSAGEGYIDGFLTDDAEVAEQRWKAHEDPMPEVFKALDTGTLLDERHLVTALKNFLALHFARSRTMREMFTRSRGQSQSFEKILGMASDPDFLAGFFRQHFGVDPAGPQALLLARDALLEMVRDRFGDGGRAFAVQLEEHFTKFQEVAHNVWCLQIAVALEGEFLIGDDPVQVVDHQRGSIGILSGVSISDADTLLMPLGPQHVLAVAKDDSIVELDGPSVTRINRIETLGAKDKVFYRPESELGNWVSDAIASEAPRPRQ